MKITLQNLSALIGVVSEHAKGEKAEITYQIINVKKDILKDVIATMEIPGFTPTPAPVVLNHFSPPHPAI